MPDNTELELEDIAMSVASMQEGLAALEERVDRIAELLEQISDGFFYLNLHVGAKVTPWVPDE